MEKIEVSLKLMNDVLGYLGTRPYQEVFQLIEGMQNEARAHNMRMASVANADDKPVEPEVPLEAINDGNER
jgi:hypothetical protein